ncbi:MAG: hypothetical protein QW622_02055 [Candidatus Pacearchaeota archaeon]
MKILEKIVTGILLSSLVLNNCANYYTINRYTKEFPTSETQSKKIKVDETKRRQCYLDPIINYDVRSGDLDILLQNSCYDQKVDIFKNITYKKVKVEYWKTEKKDEWADILPCTLGFIVGLALYIIPGLIVLYICNKAYEEPKFKNIKEGVDYKEEKVEEERLEVPTEQKTYVSAIPIKNEEFHISSEELGVEITSKTNNEGEAKIRLNSSKKEYITNYQEFHTRNEVKIFSGVCNISDAFAKLQSKNVKISVNYKSRINKEIEVKSGNISDIKNALREANCY